MAIARRKKKLFGKVGVLMGGPSSEREISFKSGRAVVEAIRGLVEEAISVDITTDNVEQNIELINSYNIDCAFVALHGRFGEDGQIQFILETLRIPYTGSGVLASKLAMDKSASRRIFAQGGLAVPHYEVLEKGAIQKGSGISAGRDFPLVVKPASHGSSIGLSIVDKEEEFLPALELAFSFDNKVLVEEYIMGREVTVGILESQALPVIEVISKRRFFDYDAKYQNGLTDYVVPAQIDEILANKAKKAALFAHRMLNCYGCSRSDIILKDGAAYLLELNTIPGFTATSLLPKAAKTVGIEFPELCLKLLSLAYGKT